MAELAFLSLRQAGALMARGETSSLDLVDACLKQIDRFEGRLKAWVVVDADGARAQARRLDEERTRGAVRGPLHGIPIAIKDIIDVAGFATLGGSPLRAGHIARRDAAVVSRLRQAGAVILGKTVTTQFASFDPPPTHNPWDLGRTPGGSSSGSAAALALGMCLASIGSQTGGSITRPAAYCGVAGLKPTYGRVSLDGILPLAFHMDHPGPFSHEVGDLATLLTVIAGYEPSDPFSVDAPVETYESALSVSEPPRLRVLTGFFQEAASPDVRKSIDAAVQRLRDAGAIIDEAPPPPSFATVIASHRTVMAVDALMHHRENFPARRDQYGPQIGSLLDEAIATDVRAYSAALMHRQQFTRELEAMMEGCDALVCPAATTTAPTPETTGDPRFNAPWSFAGVPTVCFPCGLGGDGLPTSLQLISRRWTEGRLLAVSAWSQQKIGFSARPKLLAEPVAAG